MGKLDPNQSRFVYHGDALIAAYSSNGSLLYRYVHGIGTDNPLIQYAGNGTANTNRHYLLNNHQGSVIADVTYTGALSTKNRYDEYGVPDPANQGRFGYTGQLYLKEIGLYHYKARIYNPKLGRFMQTDPVGYEDQMNLYAYVNNDPMNATDPTGEVVVFGFIAGAGLEIARQVITGELKQGGLISVGKITVAGLAGATGAGLGRGIASLTSSIVARGVSNAAAGSAIGAVSTVGNNAIVGNNLTDGVATGAALGAVGGALGSVVGDGVDAAATAAKTGAFNKLPTSTKNLIQHVSETTNSAQGSINAATVGVGEAIGNTVSNSVGTAQAAICSSGQTQC